MGVQERKQREKTSREQSILEAAKKVFAEKGIVVATMDDIAAEAELGKGTLYRHYASKEDILSSIKEQALEELRQAFLLAVDKGESGLEKIVKVERAYYRFVTDNPVYFGFIAFFESPFVSAKINVIYDKINELFLEIFEIGRADGSIRSDLDPSLLSKVLWANAYGMLQFIVSKGAHLQKQNIDMDHLYESFLSVTVNGIKGPKAASS